MSLKPTAIAVADYPVAQKPTFGGEHKVYLTRQPHFELGELSITAANTGTWAATSAEATLLSARPSQLLAVVNSDVLDGNASNVMVLVTGTNHLGAPLSGVATFAPPGYAVNTDKVFPQGYATEVVTSGSADALWKTATVTGVVCDATAVNAAINLMAVPEVSAFKLVGCVTDKSFSTKSRTPISIPCGMDGSAYTKYGPSSPGELNVSAKLFSYGDGLMRFDGVRCTAMIDVKKEEKIITDRLFFLGFTPKVAPNAGGEGADQSTLGATGMYEDLAIVPAM